MKEDFLHYIWQHQYFDKSALATTDGEPLQVLRVGFYNTDAGPDFKEAILRLGEVEWSGSVEVHLKASDWHRHYHQHDPKYDQVVLHVVWQADQPVVRTDGSAVPVVELQGRVDLSMIHTYEQLRESKNEIPCAPFWPGVPEVTKALMLERALIERLEEKGHDVLQVYQAATHDWEQATFHTLLRAFGFKINQQAFELLAKALPFQVVRKHQRNLLQLEALLLGQAGFLSDPEDEYAEQLHREYAFLSHKYSLQALQRHQWNFLRMRPANFPTVRLAQLAAMLHETNSLFSKILETDAVKKYEQLFQAPVSDYWQRHYMFGRPNKTSSKSMGKSSAHNLVVNVAVPILSAYAIHSSERTFLEKAVNLLEQVREASNKYTRLYEELGWQAKSAADNQAALGLYKRYCLPVNCMRCAVGNKIMKKNSASL